MPRLAALVVVWALAGGIAFVMVAAPLGRVPAVLADDTGGPLLVPSAETENPRYDLYGCPVYPPDHAPRQPDIAGTKVPGLTVDVVERLPAIQKASAASEGSPPRSVQMEQIAREADMHVRRGFELAGRKAFHSAHFEFVVALRLVAQGLDAEHHTKEHSQALSRGLVALEEAEDFVPRGSRLEADLDIPEIVQRHRTEVLKNAKLETMTAMEALERYFTYGQEQLAAAVRPEFAGSMALYALGKLHTVLAEKPLASNTLAAEPKAMTYYQGAILANAGNSMAANDLGVLLGRAGRFEDARRVLEYSLSISQQTTTWQNLAKVYAQLGRADLASRANDRAQAIGQVQAARSAQGNSTADGRVRWVDRSAFEPTKSLE